MSCHMKTYEYTVNDKQTENLVPCYKLTFAVCGKRDYESLDHLAGYTGNFPALIFCPD